MCTTRLSELCYDTHTKCEACRGQVCSADSFCVECEGWSADFRKLYLRHKHSLYTKRVSKKNRKEGKSKGKSPCADAIPQQADAPPPPPSDDAASVASQESHVTSPVVYLPLSQDIINANLTVEQLQEFQQVDNIVEVQLENPPAPTQLPAVYDSAFYHRTNSVVTAMEKLLPLIHKLVSDKDSPKEGTGDSVCNNPVASPSDSAPQVPVVAPQDQGLAPGPSSASLEPIASTSGLQQQHQDAIASPRGRSGERVIVERSRHASPSFQDRLRLQMDDVRRQLINAREIADVYGSQGRLPPDQVRRDVNYLQDRYSHLQSTLEDSLESSTFHGLGPSPAAHAAASPVLTPVASGSSSYRFSSRSSQRYDQRVASSDIHVLGGRPRSRESLQTSPHRGVRLPGGHCRLVGPLRLLGGEAPPVEPLRLLRDETHREEPLRLLRGLPPAGPLRLRGESPPRGRLHLSVYLLILPMALRLQKDLFRGVPNHERGHPGTPSLQGEAPLLQSDNVRRRETLSPLQLNTLHGPPLGSLRKRGQGHGLLCSKLPLPERRRKLTTPQFRPQLRPWSSLLDQTFQMPSPPRLRSPPGLLTCQSRSVSLIQRLPRDLSWAGLRLCLILSSTPRRSSLREFRRAEPATPCSLLFTALRRSPTLRPKAKNSLPTLTC